MALIDRARDVYFDRARERWKQKGFDADITDILEDYRAETNKKIKREKVNVLSTFLISLYDYDHDSLQLDITKLIVLSPSSEFQAKDKRKLLQILWSTIQMLYDDDWSEVLNEVNRLGEWARANPEEFHLKKPILGYPINFSMEKFQKQLAIHFKQSDR